MTDEGNDVFDIAMFALLALTAIGYIMTIDPSYSFLTGVGIPIPEMLKATSPMVIAFTAITVLGIVGTTGYKLANGTYMRAIESEETTHPYTEAENSIRESFETTIDKREQTADIVNVSSNNSVDEFTVEFQLQSGRKCSETMSVPDPQNWDKSHETAVLFEYLECIPPEDYRDLSLSEKSVFITATGEKGKKFRMDFDAMRENLPEGAFSFMNEEPLLNFDSSMNEEKEFETEEVM